MYFSRQRKIKPVRLDSLRDGSGFEMENGGRYVKLSIHSQARRTLILEHGQCIGLSEGGTLVTFTDTDMVMPVVFTARTFSILIPKPDQTSPE